MFNTEYIKRKRQKAPGVLSPPLSPTSSPTTSPPISPPSSPPPERKGTDELIDVGTRFFKEVCRSDEIAVSRMVQSGMPERIINALHRFERNRKCTVGVAALHVACEKRDWKLVELLAFVAKGDVNTCDTEGNSVLLWAVKHGANYELVKRMVEESNGNIFLTSNGVESIFLVAEGQVQDYLLGVLKASLSTLVAMLQETERTVDVRHAVLTVYALSLADIRTSLLPPLPTDFWRALVGLIQSDPKTFESRQPVNILLPVLVALRNFAIDEARGEEILRAEARNILPSLFTLIIRHKSSTLQIYAADTLFVFSRYDEVKQDLAAKWVKILQKLCSSMQPLLQRRAFLILAEIVIENEAAYEKVFNEFDAPRLVALLRSSAHAHVTDAICRLIASFTVQANNQLEVWEDGGFRPLVEVVLAAPDSPDHESARVAALAAIGNMLLVLSKNYDGEDGEDDNGQSQSKELQILRAEVAGCLGTLVEAMGVPNITQDHQEGFKEEVERVLLTLLQHETLRKELLVHASALLNIIGEDCSRTLLEELELLLDDKSV